MSLETVGDFLGSGRQETYFKIYVAFQVQKEIEKKLGEKVRIVLLTRVIRVVCSSPSQLSALRLKEKQIHQLLARHLPAAKLYALRFSLAR